jgi:hypothetical protein
MLLGDPGAIHASIRRRQQTDKRDAKHLLILLVEDRFPVVWQLRGERRDARVAVASLPAGTASHQGKESVGRAGQE